MKCRILWKSEGREPQGVVGQPWAIASNWFPSSWSWSSEIWTLYGSRKRVLKQEWLTPLLKSNASSSQGCMHVTCKTHHTVSADPSPGHCKLQCMLRPPQSVSLSLYQLPVLWFLFVLLCLCCYSAHLALPSMQVNSSECFKSLLAWQLLQEAKFWSGPEALPLFSHASLGLNCLCPPLGVTACHFCDP
jgi:hypothetical protein